MGPAGVLAAGGVAVRAAEDLISTPAMSVADTLRMLVETALSNASARAWVSVGSSVMSRIARILAQTAFATDPLLSMKLWAVLARPVVAWLCGSGGLSSEGGVS